MTEATVQQQQQQLEQAESLFRQGDFTAAEKLLRALHAQAPADGKINELLGYVAGNNGDVATALNCLQVATRSVGASAKAWYFLGKLHLERQEYPEAAYAFGEALRSMGDFFEGLHDMGVALNGCGRYTDALSAYDRAQRLHPQSDSLHYNRGVALDALRRYPEALQSYERALAINPDFALAWHNRGTTLNDLGGITGQSGLEQALACFTRAMALDPAIPYLRGDWLHTRMQLCQWGDSAAAIPDVAAPPVEQAMAVLARSLEAGEQAATPFQLVSLPFDAQQLKRYTERYAQQRWPASTALPPGHTRTLGATGGKRLKIGYFSPDFKSHAVAFLSAGLFEHHDRSRFELHAFAWGAPAADPMTARLRRTFEHWHDVSALADEATAALAQRLQLDVAVDLTGHTSGAHTDAFAQRCAPLQVSWLGFPGTMGANFIDYLIADRHLASAAETAAYTEKLVFMPHCFQVNDHQRTIADTLPRTAHGLDDGAFVFSAFSSTYKINPRLFAVWMRILKGVPGSLLWLTADEVAQAALRHWAEAHGVDATRLRFAGRDLPYAGHLARYRHAGLVLDTLPFSGGTTVSDALWAGAPVLTCRGDTYAGRMAASLLHTVGLPELVAPSLEAYHDTAVRLATDPAALAALRDRLAAARTSTPLFATALFTRHLEDAYGKMVARQRAGQAPDHLYIPA